MSKTARQAATGYRPSGRQCAECKHAADDCSGIDFAAMPQAGKIDKDGVQRVRCMFYERVERVSAADELEHNCCCALATGPHKMGCDYRMHEAAGPAEEEHWCELCGDSLTTLKHDDGIGWYRDCAHCGSEYQGAEERAMNAKPCRCGPDMCADRVACPRKST